MKGRFVKRGDSEDDAEADEVDVEGVTEEGERERAANVSDANNEEGRMDDARVLDTAQLRPIEMNQIDDAQGSRDTSPPAAPQGSRDTSPPAVPLNGVRPKAETLTSDPAREKESGAHPQEADTPGKSITAEQSAF